MGILTNATVVYDATQKHYDLSSEFPDTNGIMDVLRQQTPAFKCQTIYYTSAKWYEKDHVATTDVEIKTAYFIPQFRVKWITVDIYSGNPSINGYLVKFDLPYSKNVVERIYAGSDKALNIYRIILDEDTTATRINIYG